MVRIEDIYALQLRTLDDTKNLAYQSKERILEIYEELTGEVVDDATLVALNSTSRTALWRLWIFTQSYQTWLSELLYVNYKLILDDAATYAQAHNLAWYRRKSLEYQHVDVLSVVNGAVVYEPINIANRILAAAAVKQTPQGHVVIKVAKDDGNGNLIALSAPEKGGFEGYVDRFQDAGVVIQVISQNADVLKFQAIIYYDPGISPIDVFQPAFEAAIANYLRKFQEVDFDGRLRTLRFINAMEAVAGFVDVDIQSLQASVSYIISPNFVDAGLLYETVSGYIQIDANFALADTLTYVANV